MFTACLAILALLSSLTCTEDPPIVNPPPSDRDSAFTIMYPFWSHDGSKILFIGSVFGQPGYDFYEVDSSGGVARMFMRDSLGKSHPVLSPDGSKIAYLAAEVGRLLCCAHVWVMNVDGSNARDLTPFFSNWEYLRWSPDSRYVIFNGGVEDSGVVNNQIVRADVISGQLQIMTSGNHSNRDASYLFDGKRISFQSNRESTDQGGKIWVMNADGSDPKPIDTSFTWSAFGRPSPTENTLHFYRGPGIEISEGWYAINLDSLILPVYPVNFRRMNADYVLDGGQWSRDGDYFLSRKSFTSVTSDLVLYDNNGTFINRLTNDLNVTLGSYAWSPDSRKIVFRAIDNQANAGIYLFDRVQNSLLQLDIERNAITSSILLKE